MSTVVCWFQRTLKQLEREQTDTQTDRQTDKTSIYSNPRACAPRVNNNTETTLYVVKANDVIDFCYSPDLSHLNEDEQHVWGYHWNGPSLPTQHVWRVPKLGVMEVTIF